MARTHSHLNYYNPGDMLQQSQGQQHSSYNMYNGGPVQQPINYSSHTAPIPTLPVTNPNPPTSLRASSGAWSPSDDQTLMTARSQGMNWLPIQQSYFPSKTANACRKRHERLMERRNADDWDGVKLERLATAYMSMRREIWAQLAEACGEKIAVVEQKCMSQGLKNLQTHARSHARRERLHDTTSSATIPIPQNNSYSTSPNSLPHPTNSHSHSTSISSIHSNSHLQQSSGSLNNQYTNGGASFNSSSGIIQPYDDSGLGGELGELEEQDYDHENNDGSGSDRSRSAGSGYGHHTSNSLSSNGYGGHNQSNSVNGNIPRGWTNQQMMAGINGSNNMGSARLPSLQEGGMGLDRILDQRSGR